MKLKSKKVIAVCFLAFILLLAILPKLVQIFDGIIDFNHRFDKIESEIQFIKKKLADQLDKETLNVNFHGNERIFHETIYKEFVFEIFNGQGIIYLQYDEKKRSYTIYLNLEQKILKWNNIKPTDRFIFIYGNNKYYLTVLYEKLTDYEDQFGYEISIVKVAHD